MKCGNTESAYTCVLCVWADKSLHEQAGPHVETIYIYFFQCLFIYLGRWAKRGKGKIPNRLPAVSAESDVGLLLVSEEIMTRAEIKNWLSLSGALAHNTFLNNFSFLHPNALYQTLAFRAMDILRERSFMIRNIMILFLPPVLLPFVFLKKKERQRKKKQLTLNFSLKP